MEGDQLDLFNPAMRNERQCVPVWPLRREDVLKTVMKVPIKYRTGSLLRVVLTRARMNATTESVT